MKHDPAVIVKRKRAEHGILHVRLAGDAAPGYEAVVAPWAGPDDSTFFTVTVSSGAREIAELWPYRCERDALEAARHQLEVSCGNDPRA
jgi:hypothetical protein